jgi:hypothetical protein
MEDARAATRDEVTRAYSHAMYQPTLIGLNWGLSSGTTEDRIAAAVAAEDAAIAEVAKDVVDRDLYDRLRAPFDLLAAMHPPATPRRASGWTRRFPMLILAVVIGSFAIYASQFGLIAGAIPIVAAVIIVGATARSAARRETVPSRDDGPIDLPRPWLGAAGVAGIIVLTLPFIATRSVPVIVIAEATAILAVVGIIAWIRAAD